MKPILVIGSSGHAAMVLEAIELQRQYRIIGLLDSYEPVGKQKHGYVVCGIPEKAAELADAHSCRSFFVAVGDNWQRWHISSKLAKIVPDVEFPIVIHPSVLISRSARIGYGTVVMAAAVIMPDASIGEGCLVNESSGVGHDCRLADYASVSGGVHMGGASALGFRSSLGIGSTVREKRVIGQDSVIGAGSVVVDDIPDGVVAYGLPARVMRQRSPDERYML